MYWFIFIDGSIVLRKDGKNIDETIRLVVPESQNPPLSVADGFIQQLPPLDGKECRAYYTDATIGAEDEEYQTVGLRESYYVLPTQLYLMAGKAAELLLWNRNTRFCGTCGATMRRTSDISKVCDKCGREQWPQVSPAIIVRICKRADKPADTAKPLPTASADDEILLVRAHNFRRNFYGLVAGFVETGETLEECVKREVWEETRLTIKNIRYFASQPWPYPCGIMIGFTADYESGEIKLQNEELKTGGWFRRDNLPTIPEKLSIARRLIDAWADEWTH